MDLKRLAMIMPGRTGRASSWDVTGRNDDAWIIEPGETRVLADIDGPGTITHLWMTQRCHYRECLLRFTWDNSPAASVVCPLGDFFGLGHGIVNSYQSLLFSASTRADNRFDQGCALNAYVPMPFRERVLVELVNESDEPHRQYFHIDFERGPVAAEAGYFHAEFRRENPFGGWGPDISVNSPEANIANKERLAWDNNYVILDTKGRGHYLGCNLSVANFQGGWWGEGDDMIWVDGYKWPPDLHGTGSEDYLNQAWGMQDNAFLRNGSSIFEHTPSWEGSPSRSPAEGSLHARGAPSRSPAEGSCGYQTSYVHHLENPVRFQREIKVTIEHGHGNHLCNEMASVAYWYADRPCAAAEPPPVAKRAPAKRDNATGEWIVDEDARSTSKQARINAEMQATLDAVRGRRKGS